MGMTRPFEPAIAPPERPSAKAWWFAFAGADLLVEEADAGVAVPCAAEQPAPGPAHYLGTLGGLDCWAVRGADGALSAAAGLRGLRGLYGSLDDDLFALAGRAFQIVEWDRTHRFCGCCGQPTEDVPGERAKRCPACGHLAFPRLSPAVIVLVRRGGELLLARGRAFAGPFYSAIAGFVDPGESLEEAVAREVREEVGIEIEDISYFGSQSWPFPHSLMVGFTARYAGGDLRLDETEILDARWFAPDGLPELPGNISIARRLIDAFLADAAASARAARA